MNSDHSVPLMQVKQRALWPDTVSKLKVRQRSKIAEIRSALVDTGLVALDEQAATLGLSRSAAWCILKASHKSSGLSARTISRILRSRRLPGRVRQRTLEYMQEKIEGRYGHTEKRRREFAECLMAVLRNEFKSSVEGSRVIVDATAPAVAERQKLAIAQRNEEVAAIICGMPLRASRRRGQKLRYV